jgi:hypothetical protein
MPRTKRLRDVVVILAASVRVANQEPDGRSCCIPLKHTGQDFNLIRLLSLRNMTRSAGTAPIKLKLYILFAQGEPRRASIDHAANGWAMRFTKVGDAKQSAECVARHM